MCLGIEPFHQRAEVPPGPAFKRTHSGGTSLWVFQASGAGRLTQALGHRLCSTSAR